VLALISTERTEAPSASRLTFFALNSIPAPWLAVRRKARRHRNACEFTLANSRL